MPPAYTRAKTQCSPLARRHELPATAHHPRNGPPGIQPDNRRQHAIHLAARRLQAHQGPRGRTRHRDLRPPRQASARADRAGQGTADCRRTHPARRPERAQHRRPLLEPRDRQPRHRHHAHAGALRTPGSDQELQGRLPESAPRPAPGESARDRRNAHRGRSRHRHRDRMAEQRPGDRHLPVLLLVSRRDRPARPPADAIERPDAGRHRRLPDHHLPRRLHRAHEHRPQLCRSRTRPRHRALGDRRRCNQDLRRCRTRYRHRRFNGVSPRARHQSGAHRRAGSFSAEHDASGHTPRRLSA